MLPTIRFFKQPLKIITRAKSYSTIEVIKSKLADITIPEQLITDYVWKNLEKWPYKTAVICFETGRKYTYKEVHDKCNSLSINLQSKFSLNVGDTVAIILPNIPDFPVAFLGSIQAGMVVTTINPFYTSEEMAVQLKDSQAKLVFTIPELLFLVSNALENLQIKPPVILANLKMNIPSQFVKLDELCDNKYKKRINVGRPEDIAILPYSSGTTGLSKGVQLTHRNVVANLSQMSSKYFSINLETTDNFQDVIPVILPLFHIYGMVGIFLNFFSQGCKLVTIPNFNATQFVKILKVFQPTLLFTVPQLITFILNNQKIKYEDLISIRTLVSAAAPLGDSAVEKFHEKTGGRIDMLQMYGMTETSPLTLMQTTKLKNGRKLGGSGFLIPNTWCRIDPIDDGGYHSGELVIRGPQVMKGYHNNDAATREVLNDGWLRTGDIAHYDEDEHFFITGRLKELIKVKGFQVAPAELEEVLRNHSSVADAAVVGIPHPVQGEAPKAFVVLKQNCNVKPQQLKEFVASKVANYKRLVGGVIITDKIPRNVAGKILRRQLKYL